ncbi:MAG: heavy metal translocating P-type ATPase [Pseudomonadota bacterium]
MLPLGLFMVSGTTYATLKAFNAYWEKQVIRLPSKSTNKDPVTKSISLTSEKSSFTSDIQQDLSQTNAIDVEEWINRDFAIASGVLFTALGGLWLPWLMPVSAVALVYLTWPIARRTYRGLVIQKRLKTDALNLVCLPLLIFAGYIPAAAAGYWVYYFGLKCLAKAKNNAQQQLVHIFKDQCSTVWVHRSGAEVEIDFSALQVGDIVIVQGGEPVPVDGIITQGFASIDQQVMTGESQPVEKTVGDRVFAFTLMLSGKVHIRVEKAGSDTQAAQIKALLTQTTHYTAARELQLEKISDDLTLPSFILAGLTLPIAGLTSALVILDSPLLERLYISGNINILSHLSLAARHQLLIKDGRALEKLRDIDTIIFDKTGTLTQEQPHVSRIHSVPGVTEEAVLTYAATAEYKQTHPIAKAILAAAQARHLTLPEIDDANYNTGYGIKVSHESHIIWVGSARYMALEKISIPAAFAQQQVDCQEHAYSLIYIALDDELIGTIELRQALRPEAEAVIRMLSQRGLSLYIISGDHEQSTQALAHQLGIDHYFSGTLPQDKARLIQELQEQGKTVCLVGDVVKDAVALKQADLSVSLGSTYAFIAGTAQIVFMDDDLRQFYRLFALSDSLQRNLRRCVMWDVGPNSVCIGGALFLHLGIYAALGIYSISLAGGLINGLLPGIRPAKTLSMPLE